MKRKIAVLLLAVVLSISSFMFVACDKEIVTCGTVVEKNFEVPIFGRIGKLDIRDLRPGATKYNIIVACGNKTGKFFISLEEYNSIKLGDSFYYDPSRHFAV